MPDEPRRKRTIAFFDGQNLFNAAKACFGYSFPNYDPKMLTQAICERQGWDLVQTRFYTGIPDDESDPRHHFWVAKLANLGRRQVFTFSRPTRHGHEKGIDVNAGPRELSATPSYMPCDPFDSSTAASPRIPTLKGSNSFRERFPLLPTAAASAG